MRVCIVAEGCYPYTQGSVSEWIHSMVLSFPNIEFILLAILEDRSKSGQFVYPLPENVTEVYETYLQDMDWGISASRSRFRWMKEQEYHALCSLMLGQDTEWNVIFDMFRDSRRSVNDFLMGADFYAAAQEVYKRKYSQMVFSDFLEMLRAIYLPLFLALKTEVPKADLYHCAAAGYAGVLGAKAKYLHQCGFLLSEHGIYAKEREEELGRASWIEDKYKNIWVKQFKAMSSISYERADMVTCLYPRAKEMQAALGCPKEKIWIAPNGVRVRYLNHLKKKMDAGKVHIGAVLDVTHVNDVKTLIRSFAIAKQKNRDLKLWIIGSTSEEPEYAKECTLLVKALGAGDIVFTGSVDIHEYLGEMDMLILTSISEGQPFAVLEGFAAHKPVIATDVGGCRELIYGMEDQFGPAGILTHVGNAEEIAQAILDLADDGQMRLEMGENACRRALNCFQAKNMHEIYQQIYRKFSDLLGILWEEEDFWIRR